MTTSSSSSDSHKTLQKNQLEHFLHDHPLISISFENHEEPPDCCICEEKIIDGPGYGCKPCFFYVHKSCAELPQQVRNMLHPKHLLELSRQHYFHCDACGEGMHCSSYQCRQCNFDLDVKCVFEPTFQEPQGHKDHTFKIWKPALFTCDACGVKEENCISFICTACQLQVHKKCTNSYPFTVKEPRHSHLLKLTYSFQTDSAFTDKICKICFRKMNDVLFMYSCADCAYITHVICGVSTNILRDDHHLLEIEDKVFGSNTLASKDTTQQQIEHFSHPHSLSINVNGPNSIILCNGCALPISESFFSCDDQCNFFLHRYCVELNEKIQHPLHVHELTLVSVLDNQWQTSNVYPIVGFLCYGCGSLCNGFMYGCKECKFYLDVGCSFLPDILSHEGHTCALTLIDTKERYKGHDSNYKTKCNACGLDCLNKFVCEGCNFNLDLQCASLPKLIPHECPKHDWNIHPFKLLYCAIEDGRSGEFYCDVCEEERNENHWFCNCEDCDYSAHPRCILGDERLKYGSLHQIEDHPHCVRFLKTAKGNHTCETCLQPCEKGQPVYTCEECDAYFHCFCASRLLFN